MTLAPFGVLRRFSAANAGCTNQRSARSFFAGRLAEAILAIGIACSKLPKLPFLSINLASKLKASFDEIGDCRASSRLTSPEATNLPAPALDSTSSDFAALNEG